MEGAYLRVRKIVAGIGWEGGVAYPKDDLCHFIEQEHMS